MDFPSPVTLATPFFVLFVIIEMIAARKSKHINYETKDTATSLLMGFGSTISGVLLGFGVYSAVAPYALLSIGYEWYIILLCFVVDDLRYYIFHRAAHRVRWFWASHVIHHSSQHYNLSTALRQTWTGQLSISFIFRLPLVLIGFPVEMIIFVGGLNLVYQFWIHTEAIDRMGPFEWIMNTPSHHRVHHATNPRYLDRNYAGTLIIWDRMFGTFVEEQPAHPPRYGIVNNLGTFNPIRVAFHEWIAMVKDVAHAKSFNAAFGFIFAPPGWSPDGSRQTTDMIKDNWRNSLEKD